MNAGGFSMSHISTRNLGGLLTIEKTIRLSQSLAVLDAILSPEWDYRYYSFNSAWGPGEMMASMRDGAGDEYFILFDEHGAAMKGFAHESPMSSWRSSPPKPWSGIYDSVPAEFASFLNEPAFSLDSVSFCIWRRRQDDAWHSAARDYPPGADPDGSWAMLEILGGDPEVFGEFAQSYYETEIPVEAIKKVYAHLPLTDDLIHALNKNLSLADVRDDLQEIGYPGAPSL
jgi:hypothetical protein